MPTFGNKLWAIIKVYYVWDVNGTYMAKMLDHVQMKSTVDKFFKAHPFLNNLDSKVTNIITTLVQQARTSHITFHEKPSGKSCWGLQYLAWKPFQSYVPTIYKGSMILCCRLAGPANRWMSMNIDDICKITKWIEIK